MKIERIEALRADGIWRAFDCRQYPALIQHHVHPTLVPQRREDLAGDAKRRTPMMI